MLYIKCKMKKLSYIYAIIPHGTSITQERFHMSKEYKPGETVPQSGIYHVTHDSHSEAHEVTCVEGEKFPPCRSCEHPKFKLVRTAQHIKHHKHFK